MTGTVVVRVRITEDLKDEASAVAAELGFTLSDIVRLTLVRVAKEHALPFEIKVPNVTTRAAMKESRKLMGPRVLRKRRYKKARPNAAKLKRGHAAG